MGRIISGTPTRKWLCNSYIGSRGSGCYGNDSCYYPCSVRNVFIIFTTCVFLIRKMKSNQRLFWKRTNMLLFSDLAYRMKDNARAFFIVAIVSTVAFSAIGSLVGFQSLLTAGVKSANPISFQYFVNEDTEEEDLAYVDTTLSDYGIDYEKSGVDIAYYQQDDWDRMVAIVTPETYNKFAKLIGKEQIELGPDEVTSVEKN